MVVFLKARGGNMFGLGTPELLVIFLAILLLFGANKLPELARGMGKAMQEFKKAMRETQDELNREIEKKEEKKEEKDEKKE
jgi:sec-independent protein translocase protein TatA